MVSWFMNQAKAQLRMDEKSIGGHKYYLCSSGFQNGSEFVPVCGRGVTKLQAATRCIGEWLERKAAFEFFEAKPETVKALKIGTNGNSPIFTEESLHSFLPMEFWTTNGWAVHTDQEIASGNALTEALERSLLVSSFLRWDWQGFIEIGKISVDGFDFLSCLSRYKTEKISAGFAISKNPVTQGLSFGHFSDDTSSILQSSRWTQALYEALDKFGADLDRVRPEDPLAIDASWYLKNKTAFILADDQTSQEKIKFSSYCLHSEDLSQKWNLPFPLYSAFAFGGDLMPLFVPHELTEDGRNYIHTLSDSLGFKAVIPERMPVL